MPSLPKTPIKNPLNSLNFSSWKPFNWHKQHKASLTPGERAADHMRNGMGSWTFVFGFVTFLAVWAFLNSTAGTNHWDPYPFILLNLFLSMLAALQGAILLIAAKAEIELLMKQNQEQLDAIAELRKLIVKK